MNTKSCDDHAAERSAASRWSSTLPCVIACLLLAVVAWQTMPNGGAVEAERRAAEAEIAHCREEQDRMFMTPERADRRGLICAKLEAEYARAYP